MNAWVTSRLLSVYLSKKQEKTFIQMSAHVQFEWLHLALILMLLVQDLCSRRIFIGSAIKLSTKSGTDGSAGIYNCILIALSQQPYVVFLGNKRKGPKGRRSLNESCCAPWEHSCFSARAHRVCCCGDDAEIKRKRECGGAVYGDRLRATLL